MEGTTTLYFRVRLVYDLTMKGDQNFTLTVQEQGTLGLKSDAMSYSFKAKKSSISTIKNNPQSVPSAAHEFMVTIPNGKHRYFFGNNGNPRAVRLDAHPGAAKRFARGRRVRILHQRKTYCCFPLVWLATICTLPALSLGTVHSHPRTCHRRGW